MELANLVWKPLTDPMLSTEDLMSVIRPWEGCFFLALFDVMGNQCGEFPVSVVHDPNLPVLDLCWENFAQIGLFNYLYSKKREERLYLPLIE